MSSSDVPVVRKRTAAAAAKPIPGSRSAEPPRGKPSRDQALDYLGEALTAAQAHLFQLKPGVTGSLRIRSQNLETESGEEHREEDFLSWGKLGGEWCLFIETVDEDYDAELDNAIKVHVLQASAELRKLAARALPDLLKYLRARADKEVDDILEAANVAAAFARGEHDGNE